MSNSQHQRALETQQKIVNAALAIVLEQGGTGLSMTAICKRAEVSRTSLYRHFGSIQDILKTVYSEVRTRFERGLLRAIEQQPEAERRVDVVTEYMHVFFTRDINPMLTDADTAYLKKLSLANFEDRVRLYESALAPFFEMIEKTQKRRIDRRLVVYFVSQFYSSLSIYGDLATPYDIKNMLRKLIRGLTLIDAER